MGVGIWYEMEIGDPVAYLFANRDPEGPLQANVTSSTIWTLSNLEMETHTPNDGLLPRNTRRWASVRRPLGSPAFSAEVARSRLRKLGIVRAFFIFASQFPNKGPLT